MIKSKRFFAILGAATFATSLSLPALANKKVPTEINNILSKAKPVIQAEQKLEKACNWQPDLSWGNEPKLVSDFRSVTAEWDDFQRVCAGAVVSTCMYDAVGKDIDNPNKIKNKPVPYINKTVSCVDKTASDILRRREKINKKVVKGTSDAAKIAAEATKKAGKKVEKTVTKTTKKAEKSVNKATKKVKNIFKKKKKR